MFKDPDAAMDARRDAVREEVKTLPIHDDEREMLIERRYEKLRELTNKWLKWDEYLTIEIDTETETAVVVPVNE